MEQQKSRFKENSVIKTTLRVIINVAIFAILFIIGGFAIKLLFAPFEQYKTNFRLLFFLLFWLTSVGATLFYKSHWKNFSIKHNWFELVVRIMAVIFWTVVLYLAAFYGIGLEEGPWENV
jgi:hypothetical protein